jgi:hypothetical protein
MWKLLSLILGNPLDRALGTVDKYLDSDTRKAEIKGDLVKSYLTAQVSILTGPGWRLMIAFMALFIVPYAAWWGFVCVYSMFWCRTCMYPVSWSVAALPEPLNTHGGYIIAFLFTSAQIGKYLEGRK